MEYLAIDGDNVGKKIEQCIIESNEEKAAMISSQIKKNIDFLCIYLQENRFQVIIGAGDDILAKGDSICINHLINVLKEVINVCTYSVAIGCSMERTYLGLKYAKSLGGNVIIDCRDQLKYKIKKINS